MCWHGWGGHKDDKNTTFAPKTPRDTASDKKTVTGKLLLQAPSGTC